MRWAWMWLVVASTAIGAPKKHEQAAVVLLLDRSGSMQGPKLDAAKAAALAAVDALDPVDQIAIISFDSDASVLVPLQRASNKKQIAKAIAKLESGGGTWIMPALKEADAALKDLRLSHKHVILVTDGESPNDVKDVLEEMSEHHITISAIGVQSADRNLLTVISEAGNGRLYMVDDVQALPKVFARDIEDSLGR